MGFQGAERSGVSSEEGWKGECNTGDAAQALTGGDASSGAAQEETREPDERGDGPLQRRAPRGNFGARTFGDQSHALGNGVQVELRPIEAARVTSANFDLAQPLQSDQESSFATEF